MRLLFGNRTSLPHSKPSKASKSRKRIFITIRTIWMGIYVFIFSVFLLCYPRRIFIHLKADDFHVATGDFPVLNQTGDLRFSNTPLSSLRPQNQFLSRSRWSAISKRGAGEQPLLTIITVTRDAREVIRHTARFVLEQSFLPLRWLIVNDHTEKKKSYELLQEIASLDRRFLLVNSTREPGFSNGRIFALESFLAAPTRYFAFLDDDDYFEYTAYEKCVWMLESNLNASMCGTFVVGFGERNYTWEYGFHSGYKIVVNNPLTGSEVLRTTVMKESNCAFDASLKTGMEDWDFYLCLASRGLWGATIPEYLFWYRINPDSLRKTRWGSLFGDREERSTEIRGRYKKLEAKFPRIIIKSTEEFENLNLTFPFRNELYLKKSILLLIPWMSNGEGDALNLRLVQELSSKGYRVTIVCTMLNMHSSSATSRPRFMQYTHDIFTIPAVMRLSDAPRFLAYLIKSRSVETVLISNSQLAYGVLPWLAAKYRDVTFIDYIYREEPLWKNGGYAAFSTVHQTSLDASFTSTERVRQFMIQQGHDPSTVEVGNPGIDLNHLHPLQDEKQTAARLTLGIPTDAVVVIFVARTVAYRRLKVATAAFLRIAGEQSEKGAEDMGKKVRLFVIGEGPVMYEAKRMSASYGNLVTMLGNLGHADALKYLEVSDIFCLPSVSEGVSFVLTESLTLGTAALSSSVGGFSQVLIDNISDGTTVKAINESKLHVLALSEKLRILVREIRGRKETEHQASNGTRYFFGPNDKVPNLVRRILSVRRRRPRQTANSELSSLHYAQVSVLKDIGIFSDFPLIHNTLQGKERSEYGTRYLARCGKPKSSAGRLMDLLENPKPCEEGEELDVQAMRSASMSQCWKWCILDLKDPKLQSGWQAKNKCQGFEAFNDSAHPCSTWYKTLPPHKK